MVDTDEVKQVECETYRLDVELGGIRCKLVARLFLDQGKIAAVRSLRLTDSDGKFYDRVDSGKYPSHIELVADAKEQIDG